MSTKGSKCIKRKQLPNDTLDIINNERKHNSTLASEPSIVYKNEYNDDQERNEEYAQKNLLTNAIKEFSIKTGKEFEKDSFSCDAISIKVENDTDCYIQHIVPVEEETKPVVAYEIEEENDDNQNEIDNATIEVSIKSETVIEEASLDCDSISIKIENDETDECNMEAEVPIQETCDTTSAKPKRITRKYTKRKRSERVLCPDCGKYFASSSILNEHRKRHTDVCPICTMAFTNACNLNRHMVSHKAIKKYFCDICERGFTQNYSLTFHKKRHTNEKLYKCDQCDKSFFVQTTFDNHMLTHTGEKPYKCKYCYFAFTQNSNLRKHMRIHLGEEVYTCDFCPQGFRLATELQEHLMTHKNEDAVTKEKNLAARQEKEAKLNLKLYSFAKQYGVINVKGLHLVQSPKK